MRCSAAHDYQTHGNLQFLDFLAFVEILDFEFLGKVRAQGIARGTDVVQVATMQSLWQGEAPGVGAVPETTSYSQVITSSSVFITVSSCDGPDQTNALMISSSSNMALLRHTGISKVPRAMGIITTMESSNHKTKKTALHKPNWIHTCSMAALSTKE